MVNFEIGRDRLDARFKEGRRAPLGHMPVDRLVARGLSLSLSLQARFPIELWVSPIVRHEQSYA